MHFSYNILSSFENVNSVQNLEFIPQVCGFPNILIQFGIYSLLQCLP